MSRGFDCIKDINDGKELWKFGVRVEDMWKLGVGQGQHIEFLILDKQGDNIQVVIPPDLCSVWSPTLQEGNTYVMKNFVVKENDFKVKFCEHPFMLVAVGGNGGSNIVPTKIPDLPHYRLNFKPFDEIKSGNYKKDLLIDVIGAVHEVAPARMNIGSKKFPTNFSLADASMNILTCALWDDYGKQFLEQYNSIGGTGPVIVVLKHANIKEPQGQYDLQITNAWVGTKLIMDQELKEIKDFLKSLPPDFVSQRDDAQNNASGVGMFTQNSQGSQFSSGQKYAYMAPPTHLSQVLSLPEEVIVTTVGTPHHVCVSRNGWCYFSCQVCNKAVNDAPPYKCKTESHVTPNPILKYRVELEVRFDGHKCKFLFWDREAAQLIGKSAMELRDKMTEEGEFDLKEYPILLDKITGTEMAFKVKAQSNGKMATVVNYRKDPEIIQHLKEQLMNSENVDTLDVLDPPSSEASKISVNNLGGTSGETSKLNIDHLDDISEDTQFPTQDLSGTGEFEPDEAKMQTPAKRPVEDNYQEEPMSGKLSSNKVIIKNIKKEKMTLKKHR